MDQLDFAGMLRAGLCRLGLRPDEFWNLTPAELALMLGVEGGAGAMTRQRLEALAARFPDGGREVGGRSPGGRAPAPDGVMTGDQGGYDEQGRVRAD